MNIRRHILPVYWVLTLLVAGCNTSVEPEPLTTPSSAFLFTPGAGLVSASLGELLVFKITHHPDPVFTVDWQLNGYSIGLGPRYGFVPQTLGRDTLTAVATWQDHTEHRQWFIDSSADSTTTVTFNPVYYPFQLSVGDTIGFSMVSSRPDLTSYRWDLNSQVVSGAASYHYTASIPGRDTLRATAITPHHTVRKTWIMQKYAPGELRPLPPRYTSVKGGNQIATIVSSWSPPPPRGDAIIAYVLAVSYTGPLNESNWSEGEVLAEVPVISGAEFYTAEFTDSNPALRPGAHAWIAISSLNSYGVRCAAPPNHEIDITESWWISGTVTDQLGRPVADALVHDVNLPQTTRTEADGRYRIGPFYNTSEVTLQTGTPDVGPPDHTTGSWYDVVAQPLVIGGPEQWDFRLINRFGLTSACSNYDGDFLTLLRSLTRTTWPTDRRPNQYLYKWPTYPITVWIPEFINEVGLDFKALCRQTVFWWNEAMGVDFLTLVDTQAEAQVIYRFGHDDPGFYGKLELLLPSGDAYVMGEVVPELVEIYLLDQLAPAQFVQEISLHELGHALGLSGHAACYDGDYLMYLSPSGVLDNGIENAIHLDEKRALMAVRSLPQGYDMSRIVEATR